MKRVLTMLLATTLLLGSVSAHAVTTVTGDVDGDGRANNRDVGRLQQYVNDWNVTVVDADLNGDGRINNRDMAWLQQHTIEERGAAAYATDSTYIDLGIPSAGYFGNNMRARCAWDMTIYDGRLYVGCGDYDTNTGGVPVLSAPLSDPDNWSVEAMLPDEQVGRFVDYNGVLTIPGYDPAEQTKYGYYYEKINGEWQVVKTLPYALHNFDLAWFRGQLFASVGASGDQSPVVVTDDGVNYRSIPMYKNGELVSYAKDGVARSMNIYILNGVLYADYWYQGTSTQRALFELYRYDPVREVLEFVVDVKSTTHGGLYSPAGLPLWEKEVLGNTMFLTTGYLYYTTDFANYNEVAMPNGAVVYDMMEYNGRMYVLSAYQDGSEYRTTVYSLSITAPTSLRTEAAFHHALPPTAFVLNDDSFFIGMGYWYEKGMAGNGTILQLNR